MAAPADEQPHAGFLFFARPGLRFLPALTGCRFSLMAGRHLNYLSHQVRIFSPALAMGQTGTIGIMIRTIPIRVGI
ncbi:MAG: hypothetical protein WC593_13400 [Methanoregula sp.]